MTTELQRPKIPPLHVAVKRVSQLVAFLIRHPRSLVDLPRWIRDCFTPPLSRREPWWPYPMIRLMASRLEPGAQVFEFGCGGSTLWLEDRGVRVTSVEHDPNWHQLLRTESHSPDTTLLLVPPQPNGSVGSIEVSGVYFDTYVSTADSLDPGSQDLVIVDGRARVECARRAATRVRPGGWLMLDDSNRARYRPVHEHLRDWHATTLGGLKPGGLFGTETTIWQRPAAG